MINLAQGHKSVSSGIVGFLKSILARFVPRADRKAAAALAKDIERKARDAARAKARRDARKLRKVEPSQLLSESADSVFESADSPQESADSSADSVFESADSAKTPEISASAPEPPWALILSLLKSLDPKERGKGKGGAGERGPLPPDWRPDERRDKYAIDKLGEIGAEKSLAKFRRHHKTSGVMLTGEGWNDRYENWTDDERVPRQRSLPLGLVALPSAPPSDGRFYARFGSEQLDAWERHSRRNGGRGYARDRDGGWWFASEWPPDHDDPSTSAQERQAS